MPLSRPSFRATLEMILGNATELVRLCMDYFPDVRRHLPSSPDLVDGINKLLSLHEPEEILRVLETSKTWKDRLNRYRHLLTSESSDFAPNSQASPRSSLPPQSYFFGREKELKEIADAIAPDARTWGALIDGPGGIGKTALAVRAGHIASAEQFSVKIFLSAKERELRSTGEQPLLDFMLPSYQEILKELARELGDESLARAELSERANAIRRSLISRRILLIIDNVETLEETERVRLYQFLSRLPPTCKAIVTSRRRSDIDARTIRVDRLVLEEALDLINELARHNRYLAMASAADRQLLYELTNGNPLLIQWVVGQLGRLDSKCRTILDACNFLRVAPAGNDPLEYIFGDLIGTLTDSELMILSALVHFSRPTNINWLSAVTGIAPQAIETALDDLTNRSMIISKYDNHTFFLPSNAAAFLQKQKPSLIKQTASRLCDSAYQKILTSGGRTNFDGLRALEDEWFALEAAFPLLLELDNDRIQILCEMLYPFLDFSGRWDEGLTLSHRAEQKALDAGDHISAGWRTYQAAWLYYSRGQFQEASAIAQRCDYHWRMAAPDDRLKAILLRLRGAIYKLGGDYAAARTAYQESLGLRRSMPYQGSDTAIALTALAHIERHLGNHAGAQSLYHEALIIAQVVDNPEIIAGTLGSLAQLALDQQNWPEAERLTHESLTVSEMIGNQIFIASDCMCMARALFHGGKFTESLRYIYRGIDIFSKLQQHEHLNDAKEFLEKIQEVIPG